MDFLEGPALKGLPVIFLLYIAVYGNVCSTVALAEFRRLYIKKVKHCARHIVSTQYILSLLFIGLTIIEPGMIRKINHLIQQVVFNQDLGELL